ncbi:holin [Nocardia asiatica]|uniref:holin n=1 Tax=Nocardia asiatica TaxID=209252 RepID=UPI0024570ED3|nr:holin [Nocardia asiatica]
MWSSAFWKDTAERATKTFVQALIPSISVIYLAGPDWASITNGLGIAGVAAGISILTSIGSVLRGDPETASLVAQATGKHARPE